MRMEALKQLASLYKTVKWVTEQLAVQQQPSCAGPAADAASLRKLQKQAVALFKQWQPLQDACAAALDSASGSSQAQVAALSAFCAACGTGGWLPVGLQELGEGVWSAFPHKYACGDPGCVNLQALTETSAAKKSCTDCKVRPCMVVSGYFSSDLADSLLACGHAVNCSVCAQTPCTSAISQPQRVSGTLGIITVQFAHCATAGATTVATAYYSMTHDTLMR
mgnify:FL=1